MKRSVIAVLLFVIISSCWAENARLFIPFACAFPRTIITNEHFSLSGGLYSHGFWLGGYDEAAFILPVSVLPMSAFEYDEFIRRNTSGKTMSVELRAEYSFLQAKKFLLSLYGNIIFQHWRFHSREPKSVSFYGEYIGWVNFLNILVIGLGLGLLAATALQLISNYLQELRIFMQNMLLVISMEKYINRSL